MSRRTYPVPNKNLSGSDYIQNKRAKQLFSGTSNLAKTIEEQNGNFPLLTPQGKLKPYQGTYGLSGRSVGINKSYCLNTSHSYRDLLAITKGKYLITPPNISNANQITLKDVSDAKKLYNGVYYNYTYDSNNLIAYMNPGYPDPSASYVANKIQYAPSTDASQRIIVDPSYTITYSSQSCLLKNSFNKNITINNDAEAKYSFNRTINLDLLSGFQYPIKFELAYDTGDCINVNNDIQSKYAQPEPPPAPEFLSALAVAGGVGTNKTILAWTEDGAIWNPSTNGNDIFKSRVNDIKFNTNGLWLAVGGNSTDPSGNVIAYSIDAMSWTKSFTSNTAKNANNLLISGRGVEWIKFIGKWIVVGQPKTGGVVISNPSIILSSSNSVNEWNIASSTDPTLNNPFGVGGIGIALATNNATDQVNIIILAVGTGAKLDGSPINMVKSYNGQSWDFVSFPYYTNSNPPYSVIYAASTTSTSMWLVGGASGGSPPGSPIYYSTDTINWSPGVSILDSGGSNTGICYDIAYAPVTPALWIPSASYVAVGTNVFGLSDIVYSYDGINWSPCESVSNFKPRSVSSLNLVFFIFWFIVGDAGGNDVSGYSLDGITWEISANANGIFVNGASSVSAVDILAFVDPDEFDEE